MKKIFSILLIISIAISMCACTSNNNIDDDIIKTSNKNIDDEIIETSNKLLEEWGLEEGRTFSVVIDDQDIYHIDINGYELLVTLEEPENFEETTVANVGECDSKVLSIVKKSKEIIINYIDTSNILKDKEELKQYINDIPVKMADLSIDAAAIHDAVSETIFVSYQHLEAICEWMIVHELVHALCQKTNGGIENERYALNTFTEVLTDIITKGMEPKITSGIESTYSIYYNWVYLYLGCLGIDGIEAYFYGYDEILKRIPEAELDIFVEAFEQVEYSEDAIIVVCNCINDWGLEKMG